MIRMNSTLSKVLILLFSMQICRFQSTCGSSTNCVSCINSTNYGTCAPNYTLLSGVCISCSINGCNSCLTNNNCSSC